MPERTLTRANVKRHTEDGDRVFLGPNATTYRPQTGDHQALWPKIRDAVEKSGERGVMYATLKTMGGSNKAYVAYLIGDIGALRCPMLESRLGVGPDS